MEIAPIFTLFYVMFLDIAFGAPTLTTKAKELPSCKPSDQKEVSGFVKAVNFNPLVMAVGPLEDPDEVSSPNYAPMQRRKKRDSARYNDMEMFFLDSNYSVSLLPNFDQLVRRIYRNLLNDAVSLPRRNRHHKHHYNRIRERRMLVPKRTLPWECEVKESWLELGNDHFPTHVRNLTCLRSKCGFGHSFECRPRSIRIVTLKLKEDVACDPLNENAEDGLYFPPSLQKHWIRQDRTIVSSCVCSLAIHDV